MSRIHILVDREDKLRYEGQAAREGMSLGAWLREAAEEKYAVARARAAFRTRKDLAEFFTACDAREPGREPGWTEHRRVLDASRSAGLDLT